ncbi:MAG TPA: VWA domain-containing protein [Gemmatimonadales bacterium]|nr:VWA domain-containing protein [Gemmatimonadales bacterium]
MIGFTAPWALLGLAAAAIPLLLHLFARRVPPTVIFPATRYLAETARAHHRRLTLQHWLLLLVRTLIVTALVLAAAGPTWPSGAAAAHAPAALAIVLDNSLSSAATAGGTPVFEQLRGAALAILRAAHHDDALWLIAADGVPERGSPEELRAIVAGLTPTPLRLDLGPAIGIAREAMAAEHLPTGVVVLSDFQASALSKAPGRGPVVAVRPAGQPVANLGIAGLTAGRQPWGPEGGRLTATIAGSPGRSGALSLRIGTRPPRRQLAEAGASVTLPSGVLPPGWWPVRAELEPDELRLDDARETAVRVASAARATWRSEDRFLATACLVLQQSGRLVPGNDLTVGWLGTGASIVQPPEDPAQLGALDRALAARGIGWSYGDPVAGSGVTDSGVVLGRHEVTRRYGLRPAGARAGTASGKGAGAAASGVIVTVGGEPWVVRSGNLILLGSRLHPQWTELPLSAEFVPFVDFLANRAARGEQAELDTAPGQPVLLPDPTTAVAHEGRVHQVEGGSAFQSAEPGLHFLLAGRDTIGVVAVSPDPRESLLARASDAEVRQLWPGARVVTPERAAEAAFESGGLADLRGVLLGLAALLVLADAALAGLGARRATRSAA